MHKNNNLTLLDTYQILVNQHDASNDAQRVIIVGDTGEQIAESIKEALKDIKIDFKQQEQTKVEYKTIEVPQIVTEYKTIEVPNIVKQIEYKEISIPVITTEYKTIEIEKPIVITKTEFKTIEIPIVIKEQAEFPKVITWLFVAQLLINLISLLMRK